MKKDAQLKRLLLSQYGAHLVCAQLAKRGMIAELVFQNAPGIDALVYSPENYQSEPIQIKTIDIEKGDEFPTATGDEDDLRDFDPKHYYVFVYAGEKDRFFLVPGPEVRRLTMKGFSDYINKPHPRSQKTKEELAQGHGLWTVKLDDIEKYEVKDSEQWDRIFKEDEVE